MKKVNSSENSAHANSLEVEGTLLHESIHSELHRIIKGENNVPEPLSASEWEYMVTLYGHFEKVSTKVMENTQHTFMSQKYINPIANAVRQLDSNRYSKEHYLYFAWDGLEQMEKDVFFVTQEELDNYSILKDIPLNDNFKLSSDD